MNPKLNFAKPISPFIKSAMTPIAENTVIVITIHLFSLIMPIKPIITKIKLTEQKTINSVNNFSANEIQLI